MFPRLDSSDALASVALEDGTLDMHHLQQSLKSIFLLCIPIQSLVNMPSLILLSFCHTINTTDLSEDEKHRIALGEIKDWQKETPHD